MIRNRVLWVFVIILVLIGLVVVLRRALFIIPILQNGYSVSSNVLKNTSPIPDEGFAKHPLLTFIHILPGFLFMLLEPLQIHQKNSLSNTKNTALAWTTVYNLRVNNWRICSFYGLPNAYRWNK